MNSAVTTQVSWILVVLLLSPVLVESQRSPFIGQGCEVVDLIFILDRSWSLRSPENFQKELEFVAQVVSVLDFSKSRVSVVTFSDDADLNIKFNEYFRLADFQRAVRALPWLGGNTYTHKAIELMLQEYNQHIRDRAGITTIGVVITDGGSTDPYKLEDVVKVVHNDRIEMFAIGVGDEVNQQELEMLASGYDHVYLLNDLNSLSDVQDKLTARFCRGTPAPSTQDENSDSCFNNPAHVILVIDGSLSTQQYQSVLGLVSDVVIRLTRSIGRSHKFRLIRNWSHGSEVTFANVQGLLTEIKRTSPVPAMTDAEDILERDLKPGSLSIAVVIGQISKRSISKALASTQSTYVIGFGNPFRGSEVEQSLPASNVFLVRTIEQSVVVTQKISSEVCTGCGNMDLYFLLDTSNSIGPEKFARECKLASDLVNSMGIQNTTSSITTIDYSDSPMMHIYGRSPHFPSQILTHQWRGGNTMTHSALEMALRASEGKSNEKRQVAVLMSDGASTSPDRTEKMARKIHQSHLEMFVVGIGEDANLEELRTVASSPSHLYMESSITTEQLTRALCDGEINGQGNNIPSNNQDCSEAFDIVFVLDSSWSLRTEKNFKKELRFVKSLADNLQLDFNHASASVITYADQPKEYIFQNKNDFLWTVEDLPWIGGNTFTDRALGVVLRNVERRMNSVHSGSEKALVVVVITDGGSTSPFTLEKVITRLKRFRFVKIIAIGVGVSINIKELKVIASEPSDNHIFMVDDLAVDNKVLKSLLTSQICRDTKYLPLVSPPLSINCPVAVNLVFVLDSSSSLGVVKNPDVNFLKEIAFVIDVIKLGNIDFHRSRVSVITYSDVIKLHHYHSENDLVSNIIHLPFLGGNTFTDVALELMLDELNYFKTVSNSRVSTIGVILTDGQSTRPDMTTSMARRIHGIGHRIVAIGVGGRVDIHMLTQIASLPKSRNVFLLDELEWRSSFLPSLQNQC